VNAGGLEARRGAAIALTRVGVESSFWASFRGEDEMRTYSGSMTGASCAVLFLLACGGTAAPAVDAATLRDSGGTVEDTGTTDAAPRPDVGPHDSGPAPSGCAVTFSGCSDLEDHTGEAALTIGITGTSALDFAYAPHCVRVAVGTTVTIPGSALHPLHGATCSPTDSPLPTVATPADGDYTFTAPGAYGYYCNNHGANTGDGMSGVIVVE
jgi:plastocyanin